MVEMTQRAEQEVAIETLLASKGFQDAVVSLTEESADVVVVVRDLSDAKRAQIEDIVTRKAEVNAANVVITPIHESTNTSESRDCIIAKIPYNKSLSDIEKIVGVE